MSLEEFLVEAKRNTYASGRKPVPLGGGANFFFYEDKTMGLEYIDEYRGSDPFSGIEIVKSNGQRIWEMHYRGRTISPPLDLPPSRISSFLRSSLSKVEKIAPFRGPGTVKSGDFEYFNSWKGDVSEFVGKEMILFRGTQVFQLVYHGGHLKVDQ